MILTRYHYGADCAMGKLDSKYFEETLYTLELGWNPDETRPGGRNDVSCVPDGTYQLITFKRPKNGMVVPQLLNAELGVFRFEDELPPHGGRFLNLIHPGNTVDDIAGCIAPGMWAPAPGEVRQSRDAFIHIMEAFHQGDQELIIQPARTIEIFNK